MSEQPKTIVNVADIPLQSWTHGAKFAGQGGEIGLALGFKKLGCMLHVVPPGKTAFPFHRHHVSDEMFFVLSGTGEYRLDDKRLPIRPGDCVGAPAGGAAHQIINNGSEELRYLGFSNNEDCEVVEYPDSGKIGVSAGRKVNDPAAAAYSVRGRLVPAEYWDGE